MSALRKEFSVLFKKDAKGRMRYYDVKKYDDGYKTISGILGMDSSRKVEDHPVTFGLASRSKQEQIDLRVNAIINRRKDQGWSNTIEEAEKGSTNQLGFLRPMTAHKYEKGKIDLEGKTTFVQRKYNGHRCLITNHQGENIAYSRGGKLITSIKEILRDMVIPPGVTIDGELYCHGWSLQKISSAVRKRQEETNQLRFMCYDIIADMPYSFRMDAIQQNITFCERSTFVETAVCFGEYDPYILMKTFIAEGYEGAMIRTNDAGYEHGKRSKSLLKVKDFLDDEFKVVDITSSVDGWAILTCIHRDLTFDCSAPGTHEQKKEVLQNKEKYLGKYVTVKYPEFTDKGIPSQPVAVAWREESEFI